MWHGRLARDSGAMGEAPMPPVMKHAPLRTTVIGSYPFPGWLEFASRHLDQFGSADLAELQEDAVIAAVRDPNVAGLGCITGWGPTRFGLYFFFFRYNERIQAEVTLPRRHWA